MSGQEQLIKLITDALEKSPDTATDAHALYKTLSVALAHYIINNLPSLEAKAEALAKILVQDVEAGCFGCKKLK